MVDEIKISLTEIIRHKLSFQNRLDSLKRIGKIYSTDNKLRIFSWNIPLLNGTHEYSAIIQFNPDKDSICRLVPLTDISRTYSGILYDAKFTPKNWFGALYYEILPVKTNKGIVYTLLGLHFNDLFTTKKIIESMSISENGSVTFGVPIFSYNNHIQRRVVFEYGINIIMNLKYDEYLNMIIFDHLAPSSPLYTNNFKFYGPDFTFDGLKFENEKWTYYPNIDFHKRKKGKK